MLFYDNAVAPGQDTPSFALLPSAAGSPILPIAPSTIGVQRHPQRHLWLVFGPAGCGKTTVAERLANALSIPYIEGDQYHPQSDIDKMRAGIPLSDADRWDWLTELRNQSSNRINDGAEGVVVACSALKNKYRDIFRVAAYYNRTIHVHFIFLRVTAELLLQRVTQRTGHYMGANLVNSQLDILEHPMEDEIDAIAIDASQDVENFKQNALDKVNAMLAGDL